MRRLFIVFMIVLLPLRSWAGDLMSVQMATASSVAGAMPADCPMHAQADAAQLGLEATQVPTGMESCASCELCIPMAALAITGLDVVTFTAHAKPLMAGVDFLSAPSAPTFKPPPP